MLCMFLFLAGISVDPPSLFGQPLRRRLLELLALEVGRRRPVFRDGAGLVEAKRFRDGESSALSITSVETLLIPRRLSLS